MQVIRNCRQHLCIVVGIRKNGIESVQHGVWFQYHQRAAAKCLHLKFNTNSLNYFPTNLSTQVDEDAQQASTNQGITQELRGSYNAECLQDSRMHSSISKALSHTRTDHLTMRLGLTLPYLNASSCLHLSTGLCINQWDTISLSVFRK